MGYGSYSHEAHVALTRGRVERTAPVFATGGLDPLLNPRDAVRECFDSDEHPDTLGIVFALDVSGSMGRIPERLARETLPNFMASLQAARIVDPQICFMAVGHTSDRTPLQVGQFESTAALIDSWLTRLHLEGGGVGQHECYELAMWFAAHRTHLHSVVQRGRRGFFFLTVDTAPNPALSHVEAKRLLGADAPTSDLPIRSVITDLQRGYEPFVFVAPGAHEIERAWRDLFGDRVVLLDHHDDVADVAAGLVALLEGAVPDLRAYISGLPGKRRRRSRIARALSSFAASIHRDGAPLPGTRHAPQLPRDRPSGMKR